MDDVVNTGNLMLVTISRAEAVSQSILAKFAAVYLRNINHNIGFLYNVTRKNGEGKPGNEGKPESET